MRATLHLLLALCWLNAVRADAAPSCTSWPAWERFKQLYVSHDGRVVDASTRERITTSEGQSYALFFALVANDRDSFAKLVQWTQNNLAAGDLARTLPAWQWGRADDGNWRVLDANAASDADVWIAYALAEAGRVWRVPEYSRLAEALIHRILREEVADVPSLGPTLLPGPKGFIDAGYWRLNASYLPMPVLKRLAVLSHDALWKEIVRSSEEVILASAPRGFATDWLEYRAGEGFVADRTTGSLGSYNAIRVYLWAGMTPTSDPLFATLTRQLAPMVEHAARRAAPAEEIDARTLAMQGEAPYGFSAALLPLFAVTNVTSALAQHRARVEQSMLGSDQSYYSDVLSLFGLGWLDGWYRFERDGRLQMKGSRSCGRAR